MRRTWLSEMHLCVDDPGQNMQAGTVDNFARIGLMEEPDRRDFAIANANVTYVRTVVIHHGATF